MRLSTIFSVALATFASAAPVDNNDTRVEAGKIYRPDSAHAPAPLYATKDCQTWMIPEKPISADVYQDFWCSFYSSSDCTTQQATPGFVTVTGAKTDAAVGKNPNSYKCVQIYIDA